MKRLFLLALALNASVFYARSPGWLLDLEKEFPSQKFIRAVGTGATEACAKGDARAELAAYFGQTIESRTLARRELKEINFETFEKSRLVSELVAESKSNLFCVHYAPCHYDKRQKKYSACAYIDRDEAWSVLSQKMNAAVFAYKEAERFCETQEEALKKISLLSKMENLYKEFLALWQSSFAVDPKKSESFELFASLAARDMEKLSALKKDSAISVTVFGDKGGVIRSKICELLSQNGMTVASKKGKYALRAKVFWNESQFNGIFYSVPQIEVSVEGNDGTVLSFAGKSQRLSAYNSSTLERLALAALETLLDERFVQECF